MPHKRNRAYAQIDETQNKFHCEEAKARYESIFKNQKMHPEKGFTLRKSNYKDFIAHIHQVAEALNWELFCEKRPSVDEELVHEFYANLTSKLENLQEIHEEVIVPGSKWTVSKQGIHTCQREYLTPLAKVRFYFIRFSFKPSSHGTTISLELMVLLYLILTGKTIDVGKNHLERNAKLCGPSYFPFTMTILCLKAKILANVKKTGYSQGTIIDWDLYRIAGEFILRQ
ncbi:hypothetical protein PVK06_043633 [Gossypium arboreum]|uniref:Putative plant transposon protein domain-containing protein n=1 Tax=Gossypium arboreum TaxID=29729 RepID=A0ABR0MPC5_GOSAR|nr:hypothetical protein PVK06_043633 [Gossypium arboreum]